MDIRCLTSELSDWFTGTRLNESPINVNMLHYRWTPSSLPLFLLPTTVRRFLMKQQRRWYLSMSGDWATKWMVLVVGGADRKSSEHCQGTLVQGIKLASVHIGPYMSWRLMQRCILPLPICWDGSRLPVTLKGTKWSGIKNLPKNPFLPLSVFSIHHCRCSHLNDCDLIWFILLILYIASSPRVPSYPSMILVSWRQWSVLAH